MTAWEYQQPLRKENLHIRVNGADLPENYLAQLSGHKKSKKSRCTQAGISRPPVTNLNGTEPFHC